ncbi:leucine-rich repeat, partial [Perkinsela sp. CCAP 1560/4]
KKKKKKKKRLRGSIDWEKLPEKLQYIFLYDNSFTGPINLTHLPASLKELDAGTNKLSGSVDLSKLPVRLGALTLESNAFVGSVNLTSLPPRLHILNLTGNQLSQSLDLSQLPPTVELLLLWHNAFTGSVDLTHLPAFLRELDLSENKLSADPMDGHLYVVGRTSTQSLGKPGATQILLGSARMASGIGKSFCHPPLLWNTGVSGREETETATTERAHACRESYQSDCSAFAGWGRAPESGA